MTLSKPNDFAGDVLDICQRRKLTFHGCPPWYLELHRNGDMKMWFYGYRFGKPWRGGVTIQHRADLDHAVLAGDCNALADAFQQVIDHAQAMKENRPNT